MLPLRAEGTKEPGGCESYPTSEMPSKCIYDDFLNVYLSIFSLLFSHFLLLRRSEPEIQRGCYSIILYKCQTKLKIIQAKRAAVKKEPLTLENDKEDQSKCYLSYSKQPVLKWSNRDRAIIPKISALDDIVTALRLLQLLFDDVLADMIFGYCKLQSHKEKADASFEITNEQNCFFLSMLLLSGCHKLPDRKTYWEAIPNTFV